MAEAYWNSAAKWWDAWLEFERKLDMKPLGDEQIIPSIPDLQSLGEELGKHLASRNREAVFAILRKLAHGARWQPSLTIELASALVFVPRIAPEWAHDARLFTLALTGNFVTNEPLQVRARQLYRTIACIDLNQSAEALETIHAYRSISQPDYAVSHSMARPVGDRCRAGKSGHPRRTHGSRKNARLSKLTERPRYDGARTSSRICAGEPLPNCR